MGNLKKLNKMCKAAYDSSLGTKLNAIMTSLNRRNGDMVLPTITGAGATLAVDGSAAEDIQTSTGVVIRVNGIETYLVADAVLNIGTDATCAGDVLTDSKYGIGWVFADIMNTAELDMETNLTPQAYDTAIEALAAWVVATNTLPPTGTEVCIGALQVLQSSQTGWTFGTHSITAETPTYYSFEGLPGIISKMASFALEDANPEAYYYGEAKFRRGDGTIVTATGEPNSVVLAGTIEHAKVGAWIFYILSNDVAWAQPLAMTYASLDVARAAVAAASKNPLMPEMGAIYVSNLSGSDFTGNTTELAATGITTTFDIAPVTVGEVALYT